MFHVVNCYLLDLLHFFMYHGDMLFWDNVKKEILSQRTTQEWVARQCGMPHESFRSAISKGNDPAASRAFAIAKTLGVTVEYLMTGEASNGITESDAALLKLAREYKDVLHDLESMPEGVRRITLAGIHGMSAEAASPAVLAPERMVVVPRNRRSGDERIIQSGEQLEAEGS